MRRRRIRGGRRRCQSRRKQYFRGNIAHSALQRIHLQHRLVVTHQAKDDFDGYLSLRPMAPLAEGETEPLIKVSLKISPQIQDCEDLSNPAHLSYGYQSGVCHAMIRRVS